MPAWEPCPLLTPVPWWLCNRPTNKDVLALGRDGQLDGLQRDKRFSAQDWQTNVAAKQAAALYLINTRALLGMADAVVGSEKVRAKVRFYVQQWVDASAPVIF